MGSFRPGQDGFGGSKAAYDADQESVKVTLEALKRSVAQLQQKVTNLESRLAAQERKEVR